MGLTKRYLMELMEEMGEEDLTEEVMQRAEDLLAHRIDKIKDERKENLLTKPKKYVMLKA